MTTILPHGQRIDDPTPDPAGCLFCTAPAGTCSCPLAPRAWVERVKGPPTCSCRACNPYATWFIVCDTCGNKRCPRATNHDHACTGSNEPGQPGSVYGTPILAPLGATAEPIPDTERAP